MAKGGETWSKEDDKDIRTLTKLNLHDVSVVTTPAYGSANARIRRSELNETKQSFENWKESVETSRKIGHAKKLASL